MTLLAPERLWLLAVVAGLAVAYVFLQRRRRHYAVRFTNLDLLASVAPRRPGWRRHAPAAAMALALVALVVGLSRPARDQRVPRESATVMVVLDSSVSMDANDVAPNRMEAAAAAARRFVEGLPDRFLVGLVTFDGTTRVRAAPTADHSAVARALQQVTTGPRTAAGEAVFAALEAIDATGEPEAPGTPRDSEEPRRASTAAIVLLSDGVTTAGRPVEEAAAAAAERRVPVSTIAFGTDSGTVTVLGRTVPVPSDPDTMRAVAEATGGTFFEAASAEQLDRVYDDIGTRVGYEVEQQEIAMTFVAAGSLLLLVGFGAALVWGGRIL